MPIFSWTEPNTYDKLSTWKVKHLNQLGMPVSIYNSSAILHA